MRQGLIAGAIIFLATVASWLASTSEGDTTFAYRLAQLIGALALTGFACALFITTRSRLLDRLFNGLDKAYVVHKWLGIGSVALAGAHIVTLGASGGEGRGQAQHGADRPWAHLAGVGGPALVLFIALALTALIARRLTYETWKTIHRFMPIPYIIGLFHYYGTSSFRPHGVSPFSLWMDIVAVVGISSAVYSEFLYERFGFPFRYRVTSLRPVATTTWEITGQPVGRALRHRAGQFAFLKFPPPGTSRRGRPVFPSHPFTLSAAPSTDSIQFTIKASGDHTRRLPQLLQPGDLFAVSAAHGAFDYTTGAKNQVWIAGGVGLTPFRSFYSQPIPDEFTIDFFYTHAGAAGAYLDELRALDLPNLRVHLIDSAVQGFLTLRHIEDCVKAPVDIYFCGPKPLRESFRRQLKTSRLRVVGFHFEHFGFGR